MNKTEFIAKVAEEAEVNNSVANEIINAALNVIIDSLANDEDVTITGFGTFEAKHKPERKGRNPQTGESITIAAKTVPHFKPGKSFKDAL